MGIVLKQRGRGMEELRIDNGELRIADGWPSPIFSCRLICVNQLDLRHPRSISSLKQRGRGTEESRSVSLASAGSCTDFSRCVPHYVGVQTARIRPDAATGLRAVGTSTSTPAGKTHTNALLMRKRRLEFRRNGSSDRNACSVYSMSPIGTPVQIDLGQINLLYPIVQYLSKLPSRWDSHGLWRSARLSKLPSRWDSKCRFTTSSHHFPMSHPIPLSLCSSVLKQKIHPAVARLFTKSALHRSIQKSTPQSMSMCKGLSC